MKCFIIFSLLLHTVLAAPQFITFKDGKVGVNFFGYHAEAGLGGDQNGNGLFGGLHASAGTPFGQNAAAGLGGNVNGRAAGVLYAGAQASPDIGAGTILGGDTSRGGFSASEAYVPGKTSGHSRTTLFESSPHSSSENSGQPEYVTEGISAVQKIRPPKKFRNHDKETVVVKTHEKRQLIAPQQSQSDEQSGNFHQQNRRSNHVVNALQIPVGILQSLQESLGR